MPARLASFVDWWLALLRGDWGYSRRTGEAVIAAIARRAPVTLLLALSSVALAALAVWLSRQLLAASPGGLGARLLRQTSRVLRGTPAFVLATCLISVFSFYFNWLPSVVLEIRTGRPVEVLQALTMPVLTLSALLWARLMSGAPMHGNTGAQAWFAHGVWLLGALLIVDAVFALPGLGRWLIASTRFADVVVVQGVVVACVLLLCLAHYACGPREPQATPRVMAALSPAQLVTRLWLPVCWLGLMLVACALPSWLPFADPDAIDLTRSHAAPGAHHWLGTDALGRDMLSLLAHGGTRPVQVALAVAMVGLLAGALIAWIHRSPARGAHCAGALVVDYLNIWPPLLVFVLLAMAGWPGGHVTLVLALGLLVAPGFAAAWRTPRVSLVMAEAIEAFAVAMAGIAVLGFLRLAPPADGTDWGAAMAQGREHLGYAPAMVWIPALTLWLTLIACRQIAETLRAD